MPLPLLLNVDAPLAFSIVDPSDISEWTHPISSYGISSVLLWHSKCTVAFEILALEAFEKEKSTVNFSQYFYAMNILASSVTQAILTYEWA